jgi:hypothetical protein
MSSNHQGRNLLFTVPFRIPVKNESETITAQAPNAPKKTPVIAMVITQKAGAL